MNRDRAKLIEKEARRGWESFDKTGYRDQVRKHRSDDNKSKRIEKNSKRSCFPKLQGATLENISFPNFPDYKVQEAPDFDTSGEEVEEEGDNNNSYGDDKHANEVADISSKYAIDRLRNETGGIDLGLHRTDFGKAETSDSRDQKSRTMVNYDGIYLPKASESTENSRQSNTKDYKIPFEFGDRGSNWRMMKLNKLEKRPSKSRIFEQYATLWDYELACLERDELESRKLKPKHKWVYKPSDKFIRERKYHISANNHAMKDLIKKKDVIESGPNVDDNDSNTLKIAKYDNIKISKSKRLKNELKLAHLTSLDYGNDSDMILSREQIESLTNSP